MIEVDRRNGRRDGRHDVGGVEAAAKPDFEDGDGYGLASEQLECDCRCALEERRRRGEGPLTDERFSGALHGRCRVPQIGRRHFALVDDEAFFEPLEVWGGVARDAVPRGVERRRRHRGDRPLAVRSADDNRLKRALRVVEGRAERGDVVETELHPQALEAEEEGERIHATGGTWASARLLDGLGGRRHGRQRRDRDRYGRTDGGGPGRGDLARDGEPQHSRDHVLQLTAIDDYVEHAAFQEELAALKALRERLPDGLLDYPGAGKADERLRLRDVEVPQHRKARSHPSRRWIGEQGDVRKACAPELRERTADLG